MDIKQLNLSQAQRQTLIKIVEDTNRRCWRYSQPPASRYPKRRLIALQKHGLVKLVSCPMYLDRGALLGKGVEVTEQGNSSLREYGLPCF